jgi:hypothetical protein
VIVSDIDNKLKVCKAYDFERKGRKRERKDSKNKTKNTEEREKHASVKTETRDSKAKQKDIQTPGMNLINHNDHLPNPLPLLGRPQFAVSPPTPTPPLPPAPALVPAFWLVTHVGAESLLALCCCFLSPPLPPTSISKSISKLKFISPSASSSPPIEAPPSPETDPPPIGETIGETIGDPPPIEDPALPTLTTLPVLLCLFSRPPSRIPCASTSGVGVKVILGWRPCPCRPNTENSLEVGEGVDVCRAYWGMLSIGTEG